MDTSPEQLAKAGAGSPAPFCRTPHRHATATATAIPGIPWPGDQACFDRNFQRIQNGILAVLLAWSLVSLVGVGALGYLAYNTVRFAQDKGMIP